MSRIFVIEKNKDGKIELTKDELQEMLDDAYSQGYKNWNDEHDMITYPSPRWNFTATSDNTIPLNKSDTTLNNLNGLKMDEAITLERIDS